MTDIRTARIGTNGISLHVAQAGRTVDPLLVLLHGFPEYWETWRDYMTTFAAAGFHVVVPDQRGYNLSDKPSEIQAYDLDRLAADVVGLADPLNVGASRSSAMIGAVRSAGGSRRFSRTGWSAS